MTADDIVRSLEALLLGEPGKEPASHIAALDLHGPIDERVLQLTNRVMLLETELRKAEARARKVAREFDEERERANQAERRVGALEWALVRLNEQRKGDGVVVEVDDG